MRPRSSKKGLAAIEPQTCFRTDLFSSLATHRRCTCVSSLCSLLSACGRWYLCGSSCLDIPPLFHYLQSTSFRPGFPSSVVKIGGSSPPWVYSVFSANEALVPILRLLALPRREQYYCSLVLSLSLEAVPMLSLHGVTQTAGIYGFPSRNSWGVS